MDRPDRVEHLLSAIWDRCPLAGLVCWLAGMALLSVAWVLITVLLVLLKGELCPNGPSRVRSTP